MTREVYLEQLRRVARPISDGDRTTLLTELRQTPTDIDPSRTALTEWLGKGKIFFHSLGDLRAIEMDISMFRDGIVIPKRNKTIASTQACFVKDLDRYLQFFPQTEQAMREIFESILRVGTSARWTVDPQLPLDLLPLYESIDTDLIRPWVAQE